MCAQAVSYLEEMLENLSNKSLRNDYSKRKHYQNYLRMAMKFVSRYNLLPLLYMDQELTQNDSINILLSHTLKWLSENISIGSEIINFQFPSLEYAIFSEWMYQLNKLSRDDVISVYCNIIETLPMTSYSLKKKSSQFLESDKYSSDASIDKNQDEADKYRLYLWRTLAEVLGPINCSILTSRSPIVEGSELKSYIFGIDNCFHAQEEHSTGHDSLHSSNFEIGEGSMSKTTVNSSIETRKWWSRTLLSAFQLGAFTDSISENDVIKLIDIIAEDRNDCGLILRNGNGDYFKSNDDNDILKSIICLSSSGIESYYCNSILDSVLFDQMSVSSFIVSKTELSGNTNSILFDEVSIRILTYQIIVDSHINSQDSLFTARGIQILFHLYLTALRSDFKSLSFKCLKSLYNFGINLHRASKQSMMLGIRGVNNYECPNFNSNMSDFILSENLLGNPESFMYEPV